MLENILPVLPDAGKSVDINNATICCFFTSVLQGSLSTQQDFKYSINIHIDTNDIWINLPTSAVYYDVIMRPGHSWFLCSTRPDSPSGCVTPSRLTNGEKDSESGSNGTSPAPEYSGTTLSRSNAITRFLCTCKQQPSAFSCSWSAKTSVSVFFFYISGPKLFKEPSFKSNKFIIHNALSRCCLAGKVNESQKNKIVEVEDSFYFTFNQAHCEFCYFCNCRRHIY